MGFATEAQGPLGASTNAPGRVSGVGCVWREVAYHNRARAHDTTFAKSYVWFADDAGAEERTRADMYTAG